ncbi:LEG4 protein, partial [Nothocercus julius]|nr:LEG4 protein [Nothocercus julius]
AQPLPHVSPVPGGLRPGMSIYVQGVVPPRANRFRIDLGAGAEGPLALHVNPRFDQAAAVFNSRQGGAWGAEQRRPLGPLARGSPFELVISVTPGGYRLLLNGSDFEEFPHRLPPEQVTTVTVDGDVQLQAVNVL